MIAPVLLYQNHLSGGSLVASSTAAEYHVANVFDDLLTTWWKPTAMPATLSRDTGAPIAADYALVLVDADCTVEVRGSTDGFAGSDVLVTSLPVSAQVLTPLLFASASYRHWRLRFTGTLPAVAIANIGQRFVMPVELAVGFDPRGRKARGDTAKNGSGQPLGRTWWWREWQARLAFDFVLSSWLRATFEPAWNAHLESRPFAFMWAADLYPGDIVWCVTDGSFTAPPLAGGYFCNLGFEVEGTLP